MKGFRFAFLLVLVTGCTAPESNPSTTTPPPPELVGVWELVSYTVTSSDGGVRFPFGQGPKGQIIYTETGEMSAQLMGADYALSAFSGLDGPAALQEVGVSAFFAYWGTYVVDKAAGTVTHELKGCLYPDWVGADQLRSFRFEGPDSLVLWAQLPGVGDPGDLYELRWVRVR